MLLVREGKNIGDKLYCSCFLGVQNIGDIHIHTLLQFFPDILPTYTSKHSSTMINLKCSLLIKYCDFSKVFKWILDSGPVRTVYARACMYWPLCAQSLWIIHKFWNTKLIYTLHCPFDYFMTHVQDVCCLELSDGNLVHTQNLLFGLQPGVCR